jgi:hypothetical protein
MPVPAVPAVRSFAERVQTLFNRHASAHEAASDLVLPAEGAIDAVVDAAFWASLRREEGYLPKISLALVPPDQDGQALLFERPLPLSPITLARLSPAVERPGIHLCIWHGSNGLEVWGTTRAVPIWGLVIETVEPGLLVAKHRRVEESAKFVNLAVLDGDQVKVLDPGVAPDYTALGTSLLGGELPDRDITSVDVLVQLAVSMRAHGRGGSLLVVPDGRETWRESIVHPVSYALLPPFSGLAALMREDPIERVTARWQEAFDRAVDLVAGLTAVDGATIVTQHYDVVSFGAKIVRRLGSPRVERLLVTEPIEHGPAEIVHPTELGGTRHFSAAQFVQDQRDAMALIASQDGRFTVFTWSTQQDIVHAHRVEALLL